VELVIEWGLVAAMMASGVAAIPASAPDMPPQDAVESAVVAAAAVANAQGTAEARPASRFLRDVGRDYKQFFSTETALWLRVGLGGSLAVHAGDKALGDALQGSDGASMSLKGGQEYGGLIVQVPLALAWWIVGHAAASARESEAGRDLLRAQISAISWTYAMKFSIDRTRPNGDPRSFPSGHASSTFATAAVLEQHYGWKLGVPAFAAAAYAGSSRVAANKHWASDVVFGAFLGVASGRTVTLHLRRTALTLAPFPAPGGGGVVVTVFR